MISNEVSDPPMISSASVLATSLEIRLDVLLHRERHVGVADSLAQRLPVDLGITAERGDYCMKGGSILAPGFIVIACAA